MANIETKKYVSQSKIKPTVWKRFIDDVFSLWNIDKQEIDLFLEQANSFHPTIKFTAEISIKKITFLDTVVYKGERFQKDAILDIKIRYKPTQNISGRTLHFLSPTKCQKRFYQRQSY